MMRAPQDEEFLKTRRISVGRKELTIPKEGIDVTNNPVVVSSGAARMEMPATTFKWTVKAGDDLVKALRPYIHEQIKGLPANHFIAIEGEIGYSTAREEVLEALKITVIVPEAQ
jgi:hypothetical protein